MRDPILPGLCRREYVFSWVAAAVLVSSGIPSVFAQTCTGPCLPQVTCAAEPIECILRKREIAGSDWETWAVRADQLNQDHRFAEAAQAAKHALAATRDSDPNSSRRAISYQVLGGVYRSWGRCPEARAYLARAVDTYKRQPNPDPLLVFNALTSLIGETIACDAHAGSRLVRDYYQDLQQYRSGPRDDARILLLQAGASSVRGQYAEAEGYMHQAIDKIRQVPGAPRTDIAELTQIRAATLWHLGRYQESLAQAQAAIDLFQGDDAHYISLPMALNVAAMALFSLGRKEESAQVYERALGLAKEIFGEEDRVTGLLQVNYAQVLRSLKRSAEAKAMKREGSDAYRRASLRDDRIIDVQLLGNGRP